MCVYKSIGIRIKSKQANFIKLVSQFILVLSNNLKPGPIVVSDPPPPREGWGIELRNAIITAGYMMWGFYVYSQYSVSILKPLRRFILI